jgi:hypothetical protein
MQSIGASSGVQGSSCFHLKADEIELIPQFISFLGVLHGFINRFGRAVLHFGAL